MKETIGFIGIGNMGGAMIRNLMAGGLREGWRMLAVNKANRPRIEGVQKDYGVEPASDVQDLVQRSTIVVLATKPFQVAEALEPVKGTFKKGQILISVAAGVPIAYLRALLGEEVVVVRAMPNTPVQVGQGAVVLAADGDVSEDVRARAGAVFEQAGRVYWADEGQMDIVTAISGSGPAYFYLLAEQLAKAGTRLGLEDNLARELARQTMVGAGELLKRSDTDAEHLLSQVVTPGGTTAAALSVFEARQLGEVVAEAISSAARRSEQMSSVAERLEMKFARRIVVKVGSPTVVRPDLSFNETVVRGIASQIARLQAEGRQVVIVSSGAIACGKSLVGDDDSTLTDKQVLASIGQPLLMRHYETVFESFGLKVAQVLLTKEDLSSGKRADLCRNTLYRLLSRGVVPIINENDTVAIDEIVLGDNDNLSAQVSVLVSADLLVLLTDTEGLYNENPRTSLSPKVISHVGRFTPSVLDIAGLADSPTGTGGMATKVRAAGMASENGIQSIIANGAAEDILISILQGKEVGTFFSRTHG
jgi:pyrroline-5-carboxylate reductase